MSIQNDNCPCGLQKNYLDCCGAFIENNQVPSTPEALMRSRYTAYTKLNIDYVGKTMHGKAAKGFSEEGTLTWAKRIKWLGLEILRSSEENNKGWVEFIAKYEIDKQLKSMHELSEFQRLDGQWYYVSGEHKTIGSPREKVEKIGRNDPCSCGSSKKYKKCCGA